MKKEIHPKFEETPVECSCGNSFTTLSIIWKGGIRVEICEKCHQYSITMELQNPICVYCKKPLSIEFILSNNTT